MSLTPRKLRKLQKRLADQMEKERNGAPIPGEIAAKMTQMKDESLYQIVVEVRGRKEPLAVCPKMPQQYCEAVLTAMNAQISLGREKVWSNPTIVLCEVIN